MSTAATAAVTARVVNICSTLRQGAPYVASFIAQVGALLETNHRIGTISVVHDVPAAGPDHRLLEFAARDPRVRLIAEQQSDQGLTDLEVKTLQWAAIANQAVAAAVATPCTHVLYLEPDLCIPLDTLDQLVAADRGIVAPVVMLGGMFYDSWGFRDLHGEKIRSLDRLQGRAPIELSSVGSCVLFEAEVFRRGVRFRGPYESGLLVGVCADARKLGFRVFADPRICIVHPTTLWQQQTWAVRIVRITGPTRPLGQFEFGPDVRVPGFHDQFVLSAVSELGSTLAARAGPGVFQLTVTRRPRDRALELDLVHVAPHPSRLEIAPAIKHRVADT